MYVFRILNIKLELNLTLIHLALLDSSDKLICAFCAPPNYTTSEPLLLTPRTSTRNRSSMPLCSGTFQKPNSSPPLEIPWMQLKVGAAHKLKQFPGNLQTSEFPALTSEEFE